MGALNETASRFAEAWRVLRAPTAKQPRVGAFGEGYSGASTSRRTMVNWAPLTQNPNREIANSLNMLRARSFDLGRNDSLAAAVFDTACTNAVGTGLAAQPQPVAALLGMTQEQAKTWARDTALRWRAFAESDECDAARKCDFYDLQALALRAALEGGDVFAVLPRFARGLTPYKLRIQMIEGWRVSNPSHRPDTATLVSGVEMDEYGAMSSIHVADSDPAISGNTTKWQKRAVGSVGNRGVLHVYALTRPSQVRGVPLLAPAIEPIKLVNGYVNSEALSALIASYFSVLLEGEEGDKNEVFPSAATEEAVDDTPTGDEWDLTLAPGLVATLPKGRKVSVVNPGRPNAEFDPFVQAMCKRVGMATGLPYEVLVKHFSASYSASRAALIEAWKTFSKWRTWIAKRFCQPVYEEWLAEAVARGHVSAPGFFSDPMIRWAYSQVEWRGDGMRSIEPLKEALAMRERVDIGITTRAKETMAYDGGDWEENHAESVRETQARVKDGLQAPVNAAPAAAAPADPDATEDQDPAQVEDEKA